MEVNEERCRSLRENRKGAVLISVGSTRCHRCHRTQIAPPPLIGADFAALAHWKVTHKTATVVMPAGTGKTETMLALLARQRPERLLVIVPNAALREQVADKFPTFGVLKAAGVLSAIARYPVVGILEHRLRLPDFAGRTR